MHRGEGGVDGDQCTAPQIAEFSHLSEAGKGNILNLPKDRESMPCWFLDFWFLASKSVGK